MRKLIHGGDIYSKMHIQNLLDLSANINPLGMPSKVKEAIINNVENFVAYPDPLCRTLREDLAKYHNIEKDDIVCGNGAADVIFRLVLACKPKKALCLAPTFAEYEEALEICNTKVYYYDLKESNNFEIKDDILLLLNDEIDIFFLCNPNNPTGMVIKKEVIKKIAQKCKENKVLLVLDECFQDFLVDEDKYSFITHLEDYKNVFILRAFTKMYAMAGIRLGYGLSKNRELINKVSGIGQPWAVSSVASCAGIAALKEKEFVIKTKSLIGENREYLKNELSALGFKVYDSKVNYILFKSPISNLRIKTEEYGILIRSCSNYRNLNEDFYRIAVKSKDDCMRVIEVLKQIIEAENI